MTLRFVAAITMLVALGGWSPTAARAQEAGDDLDLLVSWMSGAFSSSSQAAADEDFFDISLHMVPIWTERDDGRWLYVEQAVAEHADTPYRQRVYRVRQVDENLFESRVYTFPEPLRFAGAWRAAAPLAELRPDVLSERDGCAILMRRRDDAFIGSTLGRLCTSDLRGASFATSEVTITGDALLSWDRGFDADGHQVWGAVQGGYVFTRLDPDGAPEPMPENGIADESGS